MKGVRFYLEYPDHLEKRKGTRKTAESLGNHRGTVIAVFHENCWYEHFDGLTYDCLASLYDKPNSPVCGTTVCDQYIDEKCKRISEEKAREIHPELFRILDNE